MRINDYFVFVKVVQLGSFTKVSKLLNIPLSTISTKIVKLENRLGSPLLNRSTRTLQLTEVGLNYYELIKPIVDQLELIENNISLHSKEPSGTLRGNRQRKYTFRSKILGFPRFSNLWSVKIMF